MKATLKSNYALILFYIFYLMLIYCLFPSNFITILMVHIILIIIALTPLGEAIMRLINHANKIQTKEDKDYLYPIFNDVYENALIQNPKLSKNIKLFINNDKSANAFACANNTICVTRGAIYTFSKEELQGIFAHELGHLSNNDTRISMIFFIGNMLFVIVAFIVNIFYSIIYKAIKNREGETQFVTKILNIFKIIISNIISFIVCSIFALNSRMCEYNADLFASNIGYGLELRDALNIFKSIDINSKMSIMERIYATHPNLDSRIAHLEKLEQVQ